jgi:hypothetical protein
MSNGSTKPIRLSKHARGRLRQRGFTETEVQDTIRTCPWRPAPGGRWEALKVYSFQNVWNGTHYANKKVRVIFVELATEILVVTVYTYFY